MHHNSATFLLTAALLFAGGAGAQNAGGPASAPFEVAQPTHGAVMRMVSVPGYVHARQEVTLFAKVPGYLKSIRVDKGDSVKAGDTLAEIEAPELLADVTRYRAESDAARSEYDRIRTALQKSPDLVMPAELDRAKGKYEVAEANRVRNQTLLDYARITAPFSGVVTRRFADLGAFIPAPTSGSTSQSAAIVTVMDFSSVRVQIAVPASEVGFIKKGLPLRFGVEGLSGRTFNGTVTRFSDALDEGTRTMLVESEIPNPKLELRPGMYASVQLGIERHDGVLRVPTAALVMEKLNAFVFVNAGNVAKKRPVKIGFNDGGQVEVMDGLKAEDRVILVGKRSLGDGQSIQVADAK